MTSTAETEFGVVVVSYGSGHELASFLTSLENSSIQPRHVVIVENGPSPIASPRKSVWTTTVIHFPNNPGYGSAVNAGIEAMPPGLRWILISNPDVTLEESTVSSLLREITSHDSIGSVGPALLNLDGSIYPSARAVPGLRIGIGHAILARIWKSNPWTRAYLGTYQSEDSRECGWLSGACLLVSRDAFTEIGGFDTNFFMFMEDVDLGMRFGQSGRRNVYVPSAKALHTVGHATRSVQGMMFAAHHVSARRFVAKRYPGPLWLPVRVALYVGLQIRLAILLVSVRLNKRAQ